MRGLVWHGLGGLFAVEWVAYFRGIGNEINRRMNFPVDKIVK
jgi:hypothetical protein